MKKSYDELVNEIESLRKYIDEMIYEDKHYDVLNDISELEDDLKELETQLAQLIQSEHTVENNG